MEHRFRLLNPADLENAEVLVRLNELQREISNRPITSDSLQHVFDRGEAVLCLWEPDEGLPIAMATLSELTIPTEPMFFLSNVSVHPDYRKVGIATDLLRIAGELARLKGAKGNTAWVNPQNSASMALFRRSGWEDLPFTMLGQRLLRDASRVEPAGRRQAARPLDPVGGGDRKQYNSWVKAAVWPRS